MDTKFRTIGAISSIITGICFLVGHSLDWFQSSLNGTIISHSIVFIGHLVAVFSFIALYELIYSKMNIFTFWSMICCVVGTICVNTSIFSESSMAINIGMGGSLIFGIGMIAFGIEIIRTKILSKFIGVCFILGTSMFILSSFMSNYILVLYFVGSVITCIGFLLASFNLIEKKI